MDGNFLADESSLAIGRQMAVFPEMDAPAEPRIVQLRLRVYHGTEAALGPGRADLLARIRGTESIAQAARDMGMSYMKAWKLIQSMNRCFTGPLLEVRRGGRAGGKARLTPLGTTVLELYQQMERTSLAATVPFEEKLKALLHVGAATD